MKIGDGSFERTMKEEGYRTIWRGRESKTVEKENSMNITLLAKEPEVGTPPYEFPKHSFRAYWRDDGRIGVIAVVYRQDGGIHMMQDIIDAPKVEK